MKKLLLFVFLALSFYLPIFAQVSFTSDSLENKTYTWFNENWKFSANQYSDDLNNIIADSNWTITDSRLSENDIKRINWTGSGLFIKNIFIDSTLIGKPIGFRIWQSGAAKVFINGKFQFEIGRIAGGDSSEIRSSSNLCEIVIFDHPGENQLAVKYSNTEYEYFKNTNVQVGFSIALGDYKKILIDRSNILQVTNVYQVTFTAVSLSLALLHLFLFLFDTKTKNNLFYVFFLVSFAAFIYFNLQRYFVTDNIYTAVINRFSVYLLLSTLSTGSLSVYSLFNKPGKLWYYLFGAGILLSVVGYFFNHIITWFLSYAFIMAVSVPAGRIIWRKRKNNLGGERIVRTGFVFMSIAGITNMLQSFGVIGPIFGITATYIYGVLGFIISMSLLLARDFVVTNKNLQHQLNAVKELSEKTLKQELEAKELETKKILLEADNQRKTNELEEARILQLSMLPQELPKIDNLEIAAYMKTASEVGGDYYDFIIAKDGTLNIAIGDATGHGTKAGIMVATIKSLFSALGPNLMIKDFFRRCSEILKEMNLGNLFMSLSLVRIKGNYLIASSAGMPPIFHYKSQSDSVQEIIMKGMPLGAFPNFEYSDYEIELDSGDILLLLTDGITELFNDEMKMFGEQKIMEIIRENRNSSPEKLIDRLVEEGNLWKGNQMQIDDITFIAVKLK